VAPPRGVQYFYASPAERQPASAAAVNYKVKKQSFLWHIILAILVLFCFDPLFGLVALILAGTVYTHTQPRRRYLLQILFTARC